MSLPACRSDACRSGRKACPTPDACRQPLPADDEPWEPVTGAELRAVMFWPAVCLAGVIVGALIAFFR